MKIIEVIFRCLIGSGLGSLLGVAFIACGLQRQGTGLAIMGGTLGFVLSISSVLYKTSASESFFRGLLFFLHITASKNIPGGDALVPLESKFIPSLYGRHADMDHLFGRIIIGAKVGVALAVVPAIFVTINTPSSSTSETDPLWLKILLGAFFASLLAVFVGGGIGAAIAALTVSGVHRTNMFLGTLAGLLFGAGLAIAIGPPDGPRTGADSWLMVWTCCGIFGSLGMGSGLLGTVASDPSNHDYVSPTGFAFKFHPIYPYAKAAAADDYVEAERLASEHLAAEPDSVDAQLAMGHCQHIQGQLLPAAASYDQAIALAPKNTLALYHRGIIAEEVGDPESAADYYESLLELDDKFSEGHLGLASAYEEMGECELVIKHAERFLSINPTSPHAEHAQELLAFAKQETKWSNFKNGL